MTTPIMPDVPTIDPLSDPRIDVPQIDPGRTEPPQTDPIPVEPPQRDPRYDPGIDPQGDPTDPMPPSVVD